MEDEKNIVPEGKKDPTVEELLKQLNEINMKSVSKEDYNKVLEDNKKLIKEVATNRVVVEPKENKPSKEEIIKRCKQRTNGLQEMNSMLQIESLCANYRDMQQLGMETLGVDENDVKGLEDMLQEAKGDEKMFKSLLETRIVKSVK